MIETNLPSAESELKEVINLFPKNDELVIKHKFTETPGKYSNLVTLAGKAYAFCNLSHDPKDEILKKRLIKRYAKLLRCLKCSARFTSRCFAVRR